MHKPGSILAAALLTTASSAALAQAPPAGVLQGIEQAGTFLETFVGSYRTVVDAVISKPDGSDKEGSFSETLRTRNADGTRSETIVRTAKNGEDTTIASQAKKESRGAAKAGGEDKRKPGKRFSVQLGLPEPKTVDHFVYKAIPSQGRVCRTSFAPSEQHREDEGISQGELAWWCDSLEPLWAAASPLNTPTGVSELFVRMEFGRTGDTHYIARLTTRGSGGILFIKRKMHLTMEVTDVAPASAEPPSPLPIETSAK